MCAIIAGLLLFAVGAMLVRAPPASTTCSSTSWMLPWFAGLSRSSSARSAVTAAATEVYLPDWVDVATVVIGFSLRVIYYLAVRMTLSAEVAQGRRRPGRGTSSTMRSRRRRRPTLRREQLLDLRQRQQVLHPALLERRARHAIDHARGLRLSRQWSSPPASRIAAIPSAPSSPIPVSNRPSTLRPHTDAAEVMSTSTLGTWPPGGSPVSSTTRPGPIRRCAPPGASTAMPGSSRSAAARLGHGDLAHARQPLRERAREPCGHVLDDRERRH